MTYILIALLCVLALLDTFPECRTDMLAASKGKSTVPQIFFNGEHIGGNDALQQLEQQGKLDKMASKALEEPLSVQHPPVPDELRGVITVYTSSQCKFCASVKHLLRRNDIEFQEINLVSFPERIDEMKALCNGKLSPPQVLFNSRHIGGLDELGALAASGDLLPLAKQALAEPRFADAPAPPLGIASPRAEEYNPVAQSLSPRLTALVRRMRDPKTGIHITDRRWYLRKHPSCFIGEEAVAWLVKNENVDVEGAIALGQELVDNNIIHHVVKDQDFRNSYLFYRFQEDEKSLVLNTKRVFKGNARPANVVGSSLRQKILVLYDEALSPDGKVVDYDSLGVSDAFRTFVMETAELQTVDVASLSRQEKLAFFINIYNALVIHATVEVGTPTSLWSRIKWFANCSYIIGGHECSLNDIENGILRGNRRGPAAMWGSQFSKNDPRTKFMIENGDFRIHFALVCGAKSCPPIKLYDPKDIEESLNLAAMSFVGEDLEIQTEGQTVCMSQIFKWYIEDFGGSPVALLTKLLPYMGSAQAHAARTLLNDPKNLKVVYRQYDWTSNAKQ